MSYKNNREALEAVQAHVTKLRKIPNLPKEVDSGLDDIESICRYGFDARDSVARRT